MNAPARHTHPPPASHTAWSLAALATSEGLERCLGAPWLRIVDVRIDEPEEASAPRLRARAPGGRAGGRLEPARGARPLAPLGAGGWLLPRARSWARSGPSERFARGHLPGAAWLDVRAALFDEAGEVVTAPEVALAMSGLGVGDEHAIVLVDDGSLARARAAAWVLARSGCERAAVLAGGFGHWALERRPITTATVRHPPASFTARAG